MAYQEDLKSWAAKLPKGLDIKKGRGQFGLGSTHEVVLNGAAKGTLQTKMLSSHAAYQVTYFKTVKARAPREV